MSHGIPVWLKQEHRTRGRRMWFNQSRPWTAAVSPVPFTLSLLKDVTFWEFHPSHHGDIDRVCRGDCGEWHQASHQGGHWFHKGIQAKGSAQSTTCGSHIAGGQRLRWNRRVPGPVGVVDKSVEGLISPLPEDNLWKIGKTLSGLASHWQGHVHLSRSKGGNNRGVFYNHPGHELILS